MNDDDYYRFFFFSFWVFQVERVDMDSVPRSCSQCLSDWVFCMKLLPPLRLLLLQTWLRSYFWTGRQFLSLSLRMIVSLSLYIFFLPDSFFIFSRMDCLNFFLYLLFFRMGLKEGKKWQSITWRNCYFVWGVVPKNSSAVCISDLGLTLVEKVRWLFLDHFWSLLITFDHFWREKVFLRQPG